MIFCRNPAGGKPGEPMAIQNGDFIRLNYTGKSNSMVFDTTDEETSREAGIHSPQATYGPVTVRVGAHHVILGLDEELVGKEVGDEGEAVIPPEKAFGAHDPSKVESFSKGSFKEKPKKGMTLKVPDRGEGTVVDVIGNRVLIDFNHPLAGKTLSYTYRIEEKVDGVIDQVQGLIRLYAGREMETRFEDGVLTIVLPPGINYDRRWVLWRSRVIHEGFEFIPDIREITLVETFTRPEKGESPQE